MNALRLLLTLALPLQSIQQFNSSGDPSDSRRVLNNAMMARGIGTRDFYFLEVDPLTGALPVQATFGGTITATTSYKRGPAGVYVDTSPTYDTTVPANNRPMPVLALAGDSAAPLAVGAGATSSTTLRVVIPTDQTPIPVTGFAGGPTDFGTTTLAPRAASVIGNTTGQADFGAGAAGAQTLRTVLAPGSSVTATQGTTPWITDGSATTQPISAASLPLPTGASTGALQTAGNASLSSIDAKITNPLPISGTVSVTQPIIVDQGTSPWVVDGSGVTQPISAAALPLPAGASTSALQTAGNASLASLDSKLTNPLPVSATQSGAWNTGRTWTLASGTDNVTVVQGTTPWVTTATIGGTTFDYGTSTTALRTASQIGNTTGQADFDTGVTTPQTLRTVIVSDQTAIPVTGSFASANDTDYGVVGANTLRTASQIGNATGAADFDAGATSAQTLRTVIATDQAAIPVNQGTSPWVVSGTVSSTQGTTPWIVDGSAVTQPISAASLPLPAGASTSALQTAGNASLSSIDAKLTNPLPVSGTVTADQGTTPWTVDGTVIANQGTTPWVVDGSGVTQPVSGTITANQGTSPWIIGDGGGSLTVDGSLGRTWTLASGTDSATVVQGTSPWIVDGSATTQPISAAALPLPAGASTSALQTAGNASLTSIDSGIPAALGQTTMTASMPVVIASDQSPVPVTGSFSLANDTNYGVVGANTLRTASQIGDPTGPVGTQNTRDDGQKSLDVASHDYTVVVKDPQPVQPGSTTTQVEFTSTAGIVVGDFISFADGVDFRFYRRIVTVNPTNVILDAALPSAPASGDTADFWRYSFPTMMPDLRIRTQASLSNGNNTASFNTGSTDANTLRVVLPTDQTVIPVDGSGVVQPVSGTVAATQSGTWTVQQGGAPWSVTIPTPVPVTDNGGSLTVDGTVAATQSGAWTVSATQGTSPWVVSGTVAATQGTSPWVVGDGGGSLTVDGTVAVSNLPATVNTNYGTVGASTIRTASQMGNATGGADFNTGAAGAQTLRTVVSTDSTISAENFPTTVDTNYGTVGASTLRSAAQLGNATGAVDYGMGIPTAQTIRTMEARNLTYSSGALNVASAALATDIFTITGSATKTIRVTKIEVSGVQTGGAIEDIQLVKRSTANTGGTSATLTGVAFDSTSAAATATVRTYTANPTLGTLVGTIRGIDIGVPAAGLSGASQPWLWKFGGDGSQAVVIRGTSEVLSVNLNGQTMTGGSFNFSIEWTEE